MLSQPEPEFAYLLGMLVGKGRILRGKTGSTQFVIEIPHKSLRINGREASLYVKASVSDIREILEPFIGTSMRVNSEKHKTTLSFSKNDSEMLTKEIIKLLSNMPSYKDMRIPPEVSKYTSDLKKEFLKGLADVTGHVRGSNAAYGVPSGNRVYIEIPDNWMLVVDIANLLRDVDVPVQDIDWAHPDFRDSNLSKYNAGNKYFWKKEHQIKIYADEFERIGFRIKHKEDRLVELSELNRKKWAERKHRHGTTMLDSHHRYYWETSGPVRHRENHPMESDASIPEEIRGKHFDSWKVVAEELGYKRGQS